MIWTFIFNWRLLLKKNILISPLESLGLVFKMKNLKSFFLDLLVKFIELIMKFKIGRFLLIQFINNCSEIFFVLELLFEHHSVLFLLFLKKVLYLLICFLFFETFKSMRIVLLEILLLLIGWFKKPVIYFSEYDF